MSTSNNTRPDSSTGEDSPPATPDSNGPDYLRQISQALRQPSPPAQQAPIGQLQKAINEHRRNKLREEALREEDYYFTPVASLGPSVKDWLNRSDATTSEAPGPVPPELRPDVDLSCLYAEGNTGFSEDTLRKLYFALKIARRGISEDTEEDLVDALIDTDPDDVNEALAALLKIQQILMAVGANCQMGRLIDRKPIGENK